jgi:hypothetical protein
MTVAERGKDPPTTRAGKSVHELACLAPNACPKLRKNAPQGRNANMFATSTQEPWVRARRSPLLRHSGATFPRYRYLGLVTSARIRALLRLIQLSKVHAIGSKLFRPMLFRPKPLAGGPGRPGSRISSEPQSFASRKCESRACGALADPTGRCARALSASVESASALFLRIVAFPRREASPLRWKMLRTDPSPTRRSGLVASPTSKPKAYLFSRS